MPQVSWPKVTAIAQTLGGVTNTNRFFLRTGDLNSFVAGDNVQAAASIRQAQNSVFQMRIGSASGTMANLSDLWLEQQDGWLDREFTLNSEEKGSTNQRVYQVPAHFLIERDAAVVVNYAQYPRLIDTGASVNVSHTNPGEFTSYTQSNTALYQGSCQLECLDEGDIEAVQAFVDELSDPSAWFEIPLPGGSDNHLGGVSSITAYDATTNNITIPGSSRTTEAVLKGRFGRVGTRTCRVVYEDTLGSVHGRIISADNDQYSSTIFIDGNSYDHMSNGDEIVFYSTTGLDGLATGRKYYVTKLNNTDKIINLYNNSSRSGSPVQIRDHTQPTNYNLNGFRVGSPYESHVIRIIPSGLITGTTAAEARNNFSPTETCRVRATSIVANGEPEFKVGGWSIDWMETTNND